MATSPPRVTLKAYMFGSTDHSPKADPSNWVYVTPTKLKDGQYGAPGAEPVVGGEYVVRPNSS